MPVEPPIVQRISIPPDFLLDKNLPTLVQAHLEWLGRANRGLNLTAVPPEDWLVRHVADSLIPFFADWEVGTRFLDLGTGAGFPGVPLAACYTKAAFTLLESRKKVASRLGEFLVEAGLSMRGSICSLRSEEAARDPNYRGRYDRVVCRAVAPLPSLIELGVPFLREKAELWCWKSDLDELNQCDCALGELCSELGAILEYTLPGESRSRFVISIRREGDIPDKYPRRAGLSRKKPLASPSHGGNRGEGGKCNAVRT